MYRRSCALALSVGTMAATFWLSQPVTAQINCEDPNNAAEANACLQQADRELNQVYRQVMSGLTAAERRKLIAAEQAWIKFRDTNCAFRIRNSSLNTSMGLQFHSACLNRMTRERTQELQAELER